MDRPSVAELIGVSSIERENRLCVGLTPIWATSQSTFVSVGIGVHLTSDCHCFDVVGMRTTLTRRPQMLFGLDLPQYVRVARETGMSEILGSNF